LQVRILTFPLRDENQQVLAVAQVHQSLQSVERVGTILMIVLVLGGLSAVILAFGVGYWLTRRQLRPLNELASTMYSLGAQGLHLRLEPGKATTEIGLLTEAFNKMVGRLEASFALQRAFVADVSHELRTPLTSIRGQLDVLLLNSKLKGEMRADVQQVNTEVARLSRMVVNLLTSARAEAGMSPQLSARNLQSVELDGLLVEVAHQMRYTRQQVDLEITRLQQVKVAGDADLLKQLILNLLDNALTYTQAGGKVSLELTQSSFVTEEGDPENDWVILNVADTGPGIDPADLPHIFERHYRARHTSSRSQVGAGLGLYIAGLIAQAHGGEITVQSELSKGSCFSVRLPVFTSGQLASQTEIGVAQMQQPPEEYIEQVDKQSARFSRFILFLLVFVMPLLIIAGLIIAIFFFSNELPK
jgi:two-component system OmpR family sensor kinase